MFTVIITFIVPSNDGGYCVQRVVETCSCLQDVAKYISSIDYPPEKIVIHYN